MKKNIFGTDGVRARVGQHPFTFEALPKLGHAIGAWARTLSLQPLTMLLAYDTRISASWIKASIGQGLLMHGINLIDAGVLPTPAVARLISKDQQFFCGIVISASHNPYYDNGIKIMRAVTGKISQADEEAITELFYTAHNRRNIYDQFGASYEKVDAAEQYQAIVHDLFYPNFLAGKKIILDCAQGATSYIAPVLFKSLGADVITIHNQPNGTNINENCGALHLTSLQQAVRAHQADAGFAFDGDGDRVIAVNSQGEIKRGDDLLAILSQHPRYCAQQIIVGTVMANKGLELFLAHHNKKLLRTAVGDKYVASALEEKNLLLGGEQSGHIIMRDYVPTGDGIVAALRVLEAVEATNNMAMTTFSPYPQIMHNVRVAHKNDLTRSPLKEIIAHEEQRLAGGRLLVRYSGTEPVLRIMAEAPSLDEAQQCVMRLVERIQSAIT